MTVVDDFHKTCGRTDEKEEKKESTSGVFVVLPWVYSLELLLFFLPMK